MEVLNVVHQVASIIGPLGFGIGLLMVGIAANRWVTEYWRDE